MSLGNMIASGLSGGLQGAADSGPQQNRPYQQQMQTANNLGQMGGSLANLIANKIRYGQFIPRVGAQGAPPSPNPTGQLPPGGQAPPGAPPDVDESAMQPSSAPASPAMYGGVYGQPAQPAAFGGTFGRSIPGGGFSGERPVEADQPFHRYAPTGPLNPAVRMQPSPEDMAHRLPTRMKISPKLNVRMPAPKMPGAGRVSMK